ncbi:hypothetical protein ACHAPU_007814 [Fusarium lateritium]
MVPTPPPLHAVLLTTAANSSAINMTLPLLVVSTNTTLQDRDPWSVYEDRRSGIFAWSILGFIFIFMLGIIMRDLCAKYQTGVLADEANDCKELCILLIKMPFLIFTKDNFKSMCNWFSNLFRAPERKRIIKKKTQTGLVFEEISDSDEIIERLGGGSTSAPASEDEKEPENEGRRKIPGFDPNQFNVFNGKPIPPVKLVSNLLDVDAVIPSLGKKGNETTDSAAPTPGPSSSDSQSLSMSISLGLDLLKVEREREPSKTTGYESSTLVASSSIPTSRYHSHDSDSSSPARVQGDDSVPPARSNDSVPPIQSQANDFIQLTEIQANDSASPAHGQGDESTSQPVGHTDINTEDDGDGGDAGGN